MPPAVAPGTTIDRYRVEAVIGAGSMGDVYRGVDVDLQRRVAIKILSERHRDNRELRARFVREARAVAAISHLNVVQVFTTGTFDNRPYIAMEFLDGVDLGTAVAKGGAWSSLAAAQAIRHAASGLDAAARAGLIHRDVKPTNLVRLQDGTVKVTDFGLAKPLEPRDEPALTALGVVVGTPDYIAPEQARGEPIDHRVDIYALGGTLYFLLTGIPPFRTGVAAEDKYLKVVARHLRNPVPDARARTPDADDELANLARSMMSKKPGERPSYAEIIAQLEDITRRLEREPGGQSRQPSGQSVPREGSGGRAASAPPAAGERAASAAPGKGATPEAHAARPSPSGADEHTTKVAQRKRVPRLEPVRTPGEAGDDALRVIQPRLPRWLVIATVLAALTFLSGLGLTVLGPRLLNLLPFTRGSDLLVEPEPSATPARPKPPPGMLLVTRGDGTPWFFVDARPVSHGDYRAMVPQHSLAQDQSEAAPVTGNSFHEVRIFAQRKGKHLLTVEEWRAAAKVQGFEPAGLWEWVADASDEPGQYTAIHPQEGLATRGAANAGDVTFRLKTEP